MKNRYDLLIKIAMIVILVFVIYLFFPIKLTLTIIGNQYRKTNEVSCYTTLSKKSCDVILPDISDSHLHLAYNYNSNSHELQYMSNDEITIMQNKIIYVVEEEKKQYTATFELNGATILSQESISCVTYKSDGGCKIDTPLVVRDGYEILGFSDNNNAKEAKYKYGEKIILDKKQVKLYVISKKKLSRAFEHLSPGNEKDIKIESCDIYNMEQSCKIIVPSFPKYGAKNGEYETIFVNDSKIDMKYNFNKVYYKTGDSVEIADDPSTYTFLNTIFRKSKNPTNSLVERVNDTTIVFDSSCDNATDYMSFIREVYSKSSYLFRNLNSIQIYGEKEYDNNIDKSSFGTAGVARYNSIMIRCYKRKLTDFDKNTVLHELSHSNNYRIGSILAKRLDYSYFSKVYFEKIMNQYKGMKINRPLREYAYKNHEEFVAELYSNYYMKNYFGIIASEYLPLDETLTNLGKKIDCVYRANTDTEIKKCGL